MATPITGAISFNDINTALGIASGTAISLNDTSVKQLLNQTSGAVDMNSAHACASVNTTTTNLNVFTGLFASNSTVTTYKVLIPSTVNVGCTTGNTALTLGQFATGSTIVLNNYGTISGYGGTGGTSGVGNSGGDAINANYANQTVTINNQTGAIIRGGGGGGGKGGTGGTGGSGGTGVYYYTASLGSTPDSAPYTVTGCDQQCVAIYGQGYCVSGCVGYGTKFGPVYGCRGYCGYTAAAYVGGAGGGAGGAGGSGGRGQGYDGAAAAGSTGAGGSGGGNNGGNSGTGGTGGTGASYGAAGSTGSTGNTGGTGAGGNAGGGSGGSAGATGSAGGASGRYLVKGANSVTLNNSGTVSGGLA